jgi:hypothetical protein
MHALLARGISQPVVAMQSNGLPVLLAPRNSLVRNFTFRFTDAPVNPDPVTPELKLLSTTPAECFDASLPKLVSYIWNYVSKLAKKLGNSVLKSS